VKLDRGVKFLVCFPSECLAPFVRRKTHANLGRKSSRQKRTPLAQRNGQRVSPRAFARNLNRGGFSITQNTAIPPGTSLDVELELPGRTIHAIARVIRHQEYVHEKTIRVANGVRFEQIDPLDQDEISKYLFWNVAPRHGKALRLTQTTQNLEPNS
jgi:hypothetical protein